MSGGGANDAEGYFVEPTVIEVEDPKHALMSEEVFGPVLTMFVYDDDRFDEVLSLCDETSPYGLTGAVFARDRAAIERASTAPEKRCGQLLRQRQADGRGRRSAAVRGRASLWNQRQGGLGRIPFALALAPGDQRKLPLSPRLSLSIPGAGLVR